VNNGTGSFYQYWSVRTPKVQPGDKLKWNAYLPCGRKRKKQSIEEDKYQKGSTVEFRRLKVYKKFKNKRYPTEGRWQPCSIKY
jgi:hypothetical protein